MQGYSSSKAYFREMAIRTMFGLAALEEENAERRKRLVALLRPVRASVNASERSSDAAFPPLVEMTPEREVTDDLRRRYVEIFTVLRELDKRGRLDEQTIKHAQEEGDNILLTLNNLS